MKIKHFLILLFLCNSVKAQTITTFAGNGNVGNDGDGNVAINAALYYPVENPVFDKQGNCYIATGFGNRIRKISSAGIITTIAGTGNTGNTGDNGLAISATFNTPNAVALDTAGNIYINDAENFKIRKINIITGIITTVVGNGVAGYGGDNSFATDAMIQSSNICFDRYNNMYIADAANHRIRKVDGSGIITTIAGNGTTGYEGDGGLAINAQMQPWGLYVDSIGNIYFSDDGSGETRVGKINTSGIISTIAGNPTLNAYNGDNIFATSAFISPTAITFNKCGELYISDAAPNNRIRYIDEAGIIHTIAGNGIQGYGGDNGPATEAELSGPAGVGFDVSGNLYISDLNNYRIRKVSPLTCYPEAVPTINTNTINIYPNPATTQLTITGNINSIVINNMLGQNVYSNTYSSTTKTTINISQLPAGIYIIKVNDTYVQRVLKE